VALCAPFEVVSVATSPSRGLPTCGEAEVGGTERLIATCEGDAIRRGEE
jgi:hypothetical protein